MITNDVSDYINLLVRIAHIICNRPLLCNYLLLAYSSVPLGEYRDSIFKQANAASF